ncbi:methyl-accepting chemotaxis protein [Burkholderia sp. GS2Y]|uniref:Methyl-accepting chemotaxis protein n=1 Tax=Burkholderia theae TaxID=3143496 RepID=A0ABU9WKU7_9BURK
MHSKRLSVKIKLTGAFGALAVVVLMVSGLALMALSDANDRFSGYVGGIDARAGLSEALRAAVDDRAVAVRNLVLVTAPADVDAEKIAVNDAERRVETILGQFEAMVAAVPDMSAEERNLAAALSRIEALYRPVALDIDRLAVNNQRDAAIAEINSRCRPLLAELIKASNDYADFAHRHAAQLVRQSADQYAYQRNLLVSICAAAVAFAALAGAVITRSLLRALGAEPANLADAARRIAAGDLSPVRGTEHALAGSVLASMGEMQAGLVRLIGQVRAAAAGIATGSSQIASGNVELSARTEQQAASLQQTASSMEELTSTVKQNAENARQASALSVEAAEVAERGNRVVDQVVGTMGEISTRSARIADITGIIDGIAFQTNILALNAAVEAARAGEQGRGFSVVASEVRSLAQRSSSAAKEIKALIDASVQKVQEGASLASDAGTTMSEVTRAVARMTDIMGEIAAASTEQSRGIEQVGEAITQMDAATQHNAALVEEAAAASKSLEDQGRHLIQAVAFFRLDRQAGAGAQNPPVLPPYRPSPRALPAVRKTSAPAGPGLAKIPAKIAAVPVAAMAVDPEGRDPF